MKLNNLFKIAIKSLSKNKMRTFLTMLGIIIGVASVIAMLAIGQGSSDSIKKEIQSFGTNMIIVFPAAMHRGGVSSAAGTAQLLTQGDADAIAKQCPDIKYVTPVVHVNGQVMYGANNWNTEINGVYSSYFGIRNLSVAYGSYYTETEEQDAAKVCELGQTVVDNLFGPNANPVGKYIRINKIPFKVIGVLTKRGQNSFGRDQDDIIIAPFATVYKRMMNTNHVRLLLASAKKGGDMDMAIKEIHNVLNQRHKQEDGSQPEFTIHTQIQFEQTATATSHILTLLLASIAGISLLVGGIGIMNIMLVSVTERTREIGIRLAIGARGRDVLMQFLFEAIMLSFLGGFLGVGFGLASTRFVTDFMHWPVVVTSQSIFISFFFATLIGIFFGWYPARKAAGLNPIDALRYE